jgi:hypothetical protein
LVDHAFAVGMQNVAEQIQFQFRGCFLGVQPILCMEVCEQNSSSAICDYQGAVECIQKASNQMKNLLSGRLLVGCNAVRQFPSRGTQHKDTTLELWPRPKGTALKKIHARKGRKGSQW